MQAQGPGFKSLKPPLRKKIKAKKALWQAPVIPTSNHQRPENSQSLLASQSVSSRFLRNPAIKCTVERNWERYLTLTCSLHIHVPAHTCIQKTSARRHLSIDTTKQYLCWWVWAYSRMTARKTLSFIPNPIHHSEITLGPRLPLWYLKNLGAP